MLLEHLGVGISAPSAKKLREFMDRRANDPDEASRIDGPYGTRLELEINRQVLGRVIGGEASAKFLGISTRVDCGVLEKSKLMPDDLKRLVRGTRVDGAAISLLVMDEGDEFKEHPDTCQMTLNVPLGGTYSGGDFSMRVDGKMEQQTLKVRHAYLHRGSTRHKVTKVKTGRRYSMIVHFDRSIKKEDRGAAVGVHCKGQAGSFSARFQNRHIGNYDSHAAAEKAMAIARARGGEAARAEVPRRLNGQYGGPVGWSTEDLAMVFKYVKEHRRAARPSQTDWRSWSHPRMTAKQAKRVLQKHGKNALELHA